MAPHPGREAEELEEAKVVSGGQKSAIFAERGGVDQTERWPDALTRWSQDTGPTGPVQLLKLETEDSCVCVQMCQQEVGQQRTSRMLMFCLRPRGASKNSCSLAPVLTCSSLPERQKLTPVHLPLSPSVLISQRTANTAATLISTGVRVCDHLWSPSRCV